MKPSKLPYFAVLALVGLVLGLSVGERAAWAETAPGSLWLVDINGAIGPATADFVERAIEDAVQARAVAIVLRIDTPGGLDKAMRSIVKAILAADVAVVAYVSPNGSRAASAGTYIVTAAHVAAMAPSTNIGSSTPVNIVPSAPTPEGDSPAATPMKNKIVNDAVAYLQGLAELRGRNVEWAEATVRDGANLRASEALAAGVVDFVVEDLRELAATLDGLEVDLPGGSRTLWVDTQASVHIVEPDWRHELLEVVADPTIAYALLMLGVYAIVLEFYNPGMVLPAAVGAILLLLGAYGLQMLPINYAGLALILEGIAMMVAEIVTPTLGVLGVTGAVAFVFGSLILVDTDLPGYQIPGSIIAAFTATTAGLAVFVVGAAVKARARPVVTGIEALVGMTGRSLEAFEDEGRVQVAGEAWRAKTDSPLDADRPVRVRGVEGLKLTVSPEE